MIVAASEAHADFIAAHVNAEGACELAEVYGMSPIEALRWNLRLSCASWTMIFAGRPVMMLGVYRLPGADGIGEFWCVGTSLICQHKLAFARECRRFLPTVLSGWKELVCALEHSRADVTRWALWMGAKIEKHDERMSLVRIGG